MREPRDTDFFIELPDVGTFRFGRRTFGDRLQIRSAFLSLTKDHGEDDPDLAFYAAMIATHSVLCVEAPSGWNDLAALDMTAPGYSDEKVYDLYERLRAKEGSFRQAGTEGSEAPGA